MGSTESESTTRSIRFCIRPCIAALAGFLLTAASLSSTAAQLSPLIIHTQRLPNGLTAVMVERHDAPVVTVEVWYHVGAKNESAGKTGFAHLFEHLMFDGTKTPGTQHFSDYIVRSGGIDNAYTTDDATVFWETLSSSDLSVALWLEADRMRHLDITQRAFENEREVVKEERRQRFDNPPYGTVIERMYQSAFAVHPYRHMPIGSMADLDRASLEDIQSFYDTYYVPNNATVVIVGDFATEEAEAWIKQYFGPIPAGVRPLASSIAVEPPQTAERTVKLRLDVALPAFVEAFHIPADGTADSYPLRVASKILSAGESGLIYRELVYNSQVALEAESAATFSEDPNLFFVFAVMNSGHMPAEGETAVESVLDRLKNQPLSPEELQKAKNQVLRDLVQNRETSKSLAEELGYDAVVLKNAELANTEERNFMAVTAEQVQAVAKKYFVPQNMTLLEVYPQGTEQAKTKAGAAAQ